MSGNINIDTLFSSSQTTVTGKEAHKLEICGGVVAESSSTAIDTVSSKNCELGPKTSATESTLPNPTGGDLYPCKGCAKFFQSPLDLMQHRINKNHYLLTDKEFFCEVCQKCFLHKASLKTHMIIHTGEKPFACDICGKRFNVKSARTTHMRFTHTKERPCPCKFCGRCFKRKHTLLSHIRSMHTLEKPFHCEMCEKKFPRKDLLMFHVRKHHTNERPFVCEICEKSYFDASGLKHHMMSKHPGREGYVCRFCGKNYRYRSELKKHSLEQCALGKPPVKTYSCDFCGRSFLKKGTLSSHIRSIHTLEKPFHCEMCEKKFPRKDYLMLHIRKHHTNERPFVCDVCQEGYLDASSLKSHMMSKHPGREGYVCRKCGKKYQFRAELKKHSLEHCTSDKTLTNNLMENKTVPCSSSPPIEVGNPLESPDENESVFQNVTFVDRNLKELHAKDQSSRIAIVSSKDETSLTYMPSYLTANSLLPPSITMTSSSLSPSPSYILSSADITYKFSNSAGIQTLYPSSYSTTFSLEDKIS